MLRESNSFAKENRAVLGTEADSNKVRSSMAAPSSHDETRPLSVKIGASAGCLDEDGYECDTIPDKGPSAIRGSGIINCDHMASILRKQREDGGTFLSNVSPVSSEIYASSSIFHTMEDRRPTTVVPCWVAEVSMLLATLELGSNGLLESKDVEQMLAPLLSQRSKKANPLHRHFAGVYGSVAAHQLSIIQQLQSGSERPLDFPIDSAGSEILPRELYILLQDLRFSSKRVRVCQGCCDRVSQVVLSKKVGEETPITPPETLLPLSWYWRSQKQNVS